MLHVASLVCLSVLQYIESPDVEKEVKRLLSTDSEAVSVRILTAEASHADKHV